MFPHPMLALRRLWRALWRKLYWRLFAAYIVILIATVSVQTIAADLFAVHSLSDYVKYHTGRIDAGGLASQAFLAFTISLFLATCASVIASAAASLFVARRIVGPLQRIVETSRRIAEGRYQERVPVSDDYEISDLAISFNSMAATLERTEQQRRELIGNVAHELRTPLSTIKGYMEGLIDGIVPADVRTFALIHEEADRLSRLVQDLQELSRLEEVGVSLYIRPTLISSIIAGVLQKMRPQFEAKNVDLSALIPDDLPLALADQDRIQEVLLNLLDNALHYTPSGGAVCIEAAQADGQVQIAVADNGVGIAPEHLPHIFTRFYRVDKSRSRAAGGAGIGLTIARRLTEAHEGTISVESTPGRGSRFTVTLPAVPAVSYIAAGTR